MVFIFKSSLLILCTLATAQDEKRIFDLRPKTMLMRSNREEAKPATPASEEGQGAASKETPAAPEHKVFDLRKKHSEDPPPSPAADDTAKPPSEPETKKKVFDLSKKHSQDHQEELKQHGPETNPDVEPEHKKVFDLRKKHGEQETTTTQPPVMHVENMYKSNNVIKPASNFVVVEPKQPKTETTVSETGQSAPQKSPMLMRDSHQRHAAQATAAGNSSGWFSFLLAMVIVISFLLAVANFVQRGARLHAGKPGQKGDFFKQIADLCSEGSFKDISKLFKAVPMMQPAKDPMKEV
jgi:hypothetical protein